MNSLKYNFGGKDICLCGTFLNNEHLYSCKILNKEKHPRLEYSKKFNGSISEQKEIIQILKRNMKEFENSTQARTILEPIIAAHCDYFEINIYIYIYICLLKVKSCLILGGTKFRRSHLSATLI